MSAREIHDRVTRKMAADAMKSARRNRRFGDVRPFGVLEAGAALAGDMCARYLATGERGLAHGCARAHAQILASQDRMIARWRARELAESPIPESRIGVPA